jgi:hypothetical protein
MMPILRGLAPLVVLAAIAVFASCEEPPPTLVDTDLARLEGNVAYFCWLDPDGTLHDCEFSCVEPEEVFDSTTGTCYDPNYEVPGEDPDPEEPGPGGGGPPPQYADTLNVIVKINCGGAVVRGSDVSCGISITAMTDDSVQVTPPPMTVHRWRFVSYDNTIIEPSSSVEWEGPAVQSGTVSAEVTVANTQKWWTGPAQDGTITVTPRSWSWGASQRSFATGQPGDLDNCSAGGDTGLTADVYGCTAASPSTLINPGPGLGFTVEPVDDGPNQTLWYVIDPVTRMDLRTQVARKYRPDGIKYTANGLSQVVQACGVAYSPNPVPQQNNHGVNTVCFQIPDFTSLVNWAWNHEALHLSAAQPEAESSGNDLYALWEPIVGASASVVFDEERVPSLVGIEVTSDLR